MIKKIAALALLSFGLVHGASADPILNYSTFDLGFTSTGDNMGFGSSSTAGIDTKASYLLSDNLFATAGFSHENDDNFNSHGFDFSVGGYVPITEDIHFLASFGYVSQRASFGSDFISDPDFPDQEPSERDVLTSDDTYISPAFRARLMKNLELGIFYKRYNDDFVALSDQDLFGGNLIIGTNDHFALTLQLERISSSDGQFTAGIRYAL
jgi:hypothetical protein